MRKSGLWLLVLSCAVAVSTLHAETLDIQGVGATFPAPLYSKWIKEYNQLQSNAKIDYQAIGSGGGIHAILDQTVAFAGSDAPLETDRMQSAKGKILHIPTVSGPVAMIYNLPEVKALTLNGDVIADIYLGKITKWNDPRIAAINVGVTLPDVDVVVVHRSDGSGTTWIFTNYLSKISEEWKKKIGNGTSVSWPVGLGGKGGDGIGANVKNAPGSIGYVELAYAENSKISYASLVNKAGKVVRPSLEGVKEAGMHSALEIPDDLRVSITDAQGDGSYPICGFTYLLIYEDLSYLKSKDKAVELVKFINWGLHDGQKMADPGYVALTAELNKRACAVLDSVKFNGKPLK